MAPGLNGPSERGILIRHFDPSRNSLQLYPMLFAEYRSICMLTKNYRTFEL